MGLLGFFLPFIFVYVTALDWRDDKVRDKVFV